MEITDFIDVNFIDVNFQAKKKDDVLKYIARLASRSELPDGINEESIFKSLAEREEIGTTGFGGGIAIPHARIKGLDNFIVIILISKKGVNFDALDSRKVNIFCGILAPEEQVDQHLKILASFSRLLSISAFRRELIAASQPDIVYETISRYANAPRGNKMSGKMKMMIIILYYDEYLYEILEYLIQNEIKGATIIESAGMGSYISSIPVFASFLGFMREDKNKSKTIICLIPEEKENTVIEEVETITGDLDKKQGAMIMTIDLARYKGTMEII